MGSTIKNTSKMRIPVVVALAVLTIGTLSVHAHILDVRATAVSAGGSISGDGKTVMILAGGTVTFGVYINLSGTPYDGCWAWSGTIRSGNGTATGVGRENYTDGSGNHLWPVDPTPVDTVLNATTEHYSADGLAAMPIPAYWYAALSAASTADQTGLPQDPDPNDTDYDARGFSVNGTSDLVHGVAKTGDLQVADATFANAGLLHGAIFEEVDVNLYFTLPAAPNSGARVSVINADTIHLTANILTGAAGEIGTPVAVTVGLPEPMSGSLLLLGLAGWALRRRRA